MQPPIPNIIKIVAALITDEEDRVLLVRKRGTRYFMQPGGKSKPNETASETLRRELLEELGCFILEDSIRFRGRFTSQAANEQGYQVDAEIYELKILGEPIARAEIDELAWVHADNREQVMLAPLTRDRVLALV